MATLPADWDFIQWGYWLNKHNLSIWLDFEITKVRIDGYGPWNWQTVAEQQAFNLVLFLYRQQNYFIHMERLDTPSLSRGAVRGPATLPAFKKTTYKI